MRWLIGARDWLGFTPPIHPVPDPMTHREQLHLLTALVVMLIVCLTVGFILGSTDGVAKALHAVDALAL